MSKQVYNIKEAVADFGVSRDQIFRALRAGDLAELDPRVEGKSIKPVLIAADELWRWMRNEDRNV